MKSVDSILIRLATASDSHTVGNLVCRLNCELLPDEFDLSDQVRFSSNARSLLENENGFWVALAFNEASDGELSPIAMMSMNEGHALYTPNCVGEIMELYVDPTQRSAGVGARLVAFAVEFGRERGWPVIKVGAPEVPQWQRTLDYYVKCGFCERGPRLMMVL